MTVRALTAPNPGPFTLDGTKTWLLGEGAVLDPGPMIDAHVEAIRCELPGLKTILVTHRHPDHAPAAIPLRERTGAEIWAPRGALPESVADRILEDGDRIEAGGLDLEVIATPGHTVEHICFLSDSGELFTGDMVLGVGTTVILPPDGDMGDYIESLRTLLARRPGRIHPGHGPTRDDAVALLEEYIAHRLQREEEVIAGLTAGVTSISGLRLRVYPQLAASLHAAAEVQISAHLDLLVKKGRVSTDGGSFTVVG